MIFAFLFSFLTYAEEDTYKVSQPQGVFFAETFQTPITGRWIQSTNPKFPGEWVVGRLDTANYLGDEQSLILKRPAQHHAISAKFPRSIGGVDGKDLVVQYEVRFNQAHSCGGAYIKLLHADSFTPETFDNETPYVIMFGPDKCGTEDRVHFIFRHKSPITNKWEEKHLVNKPKIKNDLMVHLYTLVVRKDNSYEVFIDQKSEQKGSLLEDFQPSVNPPKEIDDPTDLKPRDWVDLATIPDPDASKPDDWDEDAPKHIIDEAAVKPSTWCDDCPTQIPDPTANKPDDWDDEMDGDWTPPTTANPVCIESGCGDWEPPTIPNPSYKGKWSAPMIANPAYKGPWKARQIPNPDYFEDNVPHKLAPMQGVGFELWTMQDNIEFDNVFIDHSEDAAFEFASQTWAKKFAADKASKGQDESVFEQLGVWVSENLVIFIVGVVGTLSALIFSCVWICSGSDEPAPRREHKHSRQHSHSSSSEGAPSASSSTTSATTATTAEPAAAAAASSSSTASSTESSTSGAQQRKPKKNSTKKAE